MFDFLQGTPYGWLIPYLTAAVAVCSALDATLPQPAPGSHALLLRKLISFVALNFGAASNGQQPSIATWKQRMLQALAAAVLPPQQAAALQQIMAVQPGPGNAPAAAPAVPVAPAPVPTPPAQLTLPLAPALAPAAAPVAAAPTAPAAGTPLAAPQQPVVNGQ